MKFAIEPYVGIEGIKFGMTRDAVRNALASVKFSTFMKGPYSTFPTDAFSEIGLHVYYKAPGICSALEFVLSAEPTLLGRQLMGVPFSELRSWLLALDPSAELIGTGLISRKFGISPYVMDAFRHPEDPVESVYAFEEGHYESKALEISRIKTGAGS